MTHEVVLRIQRLLDIEMALEEAGIAIGTTAAGVKDAIQSLRQRLAAAELHVRQLETAFSLVKHREAATAALAALRVASTRVQMGLSKAAVTSALHEAHAALVRIETESKADPAAPYEMGYALGRQLGDEEGYARCLRDVARGLGAVGGPTSAWLTRERGQRVELWAKMGRASSDDAPIVNAEVAGSRTRI